MNWFDPGPSGQMPQGDSVSAEFSRKVWFLQQRHYFRYMSRSKAKWLSPIQTIPLGLSPAVCVSINMWRLFLVVDNDVQGAWQGHFSGHVQVPRSRPELCKSVFHCFQCSMPSLATFSRSAPPWQHRKDSPCTLYAIVYILICFLIECTFESFRHLSGVQNSRALCYSISTENFNADFFERFTQDATTRGTITNETINSGFGEWEMIVLWAGPWPPTLLDKTT